MSMTMNKTVKQGGVLELPPAESQLCIDWQQRVGEVFAEFGFSRLDTPCILPLEVLRGKGEAADKQMFSVVGGQGEDSHATRGLRYDLTVPLARTVALFKNDIRFPARLCQIGNVWRGERQAAGRYREFIQADCDVLSRGRIPLAIDAELIELANVALQKIGVEAVSRVSNRKIIAGLLQGLGVEAEKTTPAMRAIDKLDRLGPTEVRHLLEDEVGIGPEESRLCLRLAEIKTEDCSFVDRVQALGVEHALLTEGLRELSEVVQFLAVLGRGTVVADLSIARGLDYYTGTVYEATLIDFPDDGSIAAGGRYENLVGGFAKERIAGVGISLGLTRIFSILRNHGRLKPPGKLTQVLVAWPRGVSAERVAETARKLRGRGMRVEVFAGGPAKLDKQLAFALETGIQYVWFPWENPEVKNLDAGHQVAADPDSWTPGPAHRSI